MENEFDSNYLGIENDYEITNIVILNKLLKETEANLKNGSYLTALSTALTIPDICYSYLKSDVIARDLSHINTGGLGNSSLRYAYFTDKFADISLLKMNPLSLKPDSFLIGLLSYYLRCSLLHNGELLVEPSYGNQSSMSYFETDLKYLLQDKTTSIQSEDDKSQLELRINRLSSQKRLTLTDDPNPLNLELKFIIGVDSSDGSIIIQRDDYSQFFLNTTNLIEFLINAGKSFIESEDFDRTPIYQDVHSPSKKFILGKSKLDDAHM